MLLSCGLLFCDMCSSREAALLDVRKAICSMQPVGNANIQIIK